MAAEGMGAWEKKNLPKQHSVWKYEERKNIYHSNKKVFIIVIKNKLSISKFNKIHENFIWKKETSQRGTHTHTHKSRQLLSQK